MGVVSKTDEETVGARCQRGVYGDAASLRCIMGALNEFSRT